MSDLKEFKKSRAIVLKALEAKCAKKGLSLVDVGIGTEHNLCALTNSFYDMARTAGQDVNPNYLTAVTSSYVFGVVVARDVRKRGSDVVIM